MIDNANLVKYVQKGLYNPTLLDQTLTEITLVVIKRHYSQCMHDPEVLEVGRFKALLLLHSDHANSQRNLVNFLFTGIRNEIGNMLKREKKMSSIMESFSEAVRYDNYCFCKMKDDEEAFKRILEIMKEILDRFEYIGMDIRPNIQEFLHNFNEETLSGYGKFVVQSSFVRALIK